MTRPRSCHRVSNSVSGEGESSERWGGGQQPAQEATGIREIGVRPGSESSLGPREAGWDAAWERADSE